MNMVSGSAMVYGVLSGKQKKGTVKRKWKHNRRPSVPPIDPVMLCLLGLLINVDSNVLISLSFFPPYSMTHGNKDVSCIVHVACS